LDEIVVVRREALVNHLKKRDLVFQHLKSEAAKAKHFPCCHAFLAAKCDHIQPPSVDFKQNAIFAKWKFVGCNSFHF